MATRPGLSPQPQAAAATAPDTDTTPDVDPYANGTLLYHQTIIPTQGISHAVKGSFTLPGSNDLILVRHNTLELWTLYMGSGSGSSSSAECIHSCPLFVNVLGAAAVPTGLGGGGGGNGGSGTVASTQAADRAGGSSAASLFASGGSYDYLIVTSETGYATLLRYELAEPPVPTRTSFLSPVEGGASSRGAENDGGGSSSTYVAPSLAGRFVKVSEVCLGRSGARLTVPGARIAVDPNGGAVMVTSLMRHKVVLPLRRTAFGQSTTGQSASALAWLGAGSSQGWTSGSGLLGDDSDDGEDGREDDEEGAGTRGGASSRMKGSQDDEAVGRQLARKRRRLAAPRGVLALGSAIEAHRQTVILSCCALDGFVETSVFAVLEQDTVEAHTQAQAAADQSHDKPRTATGDGANVNAAAAAGALGKDKHEDSTKNKMGKFLVVYAYVPSLQQVQRTHLVRLPPTAHRLVAVPAAPFGPGGVLVCTDTELIWYDLSPGAYAGNNNNSGGPNGPNGEASTAVFKCFAPLPRRMAFTETLYDPSIIAHAVTCVRKDFFMLLQDEHGDLFRVFLSSADVQRAYDALRAATAATAAGGVPPRVVNPLAVHYFDTIAPVSDMALFPRGFLLAGAETGSFHGLYKIVRDGYMKESEYIVKRVKRVREVPVPTAKEERTSASDALADTKRPREQDDGKADAANTATATDSTDEVKKEEPHDVDDRKPKATGTLLALLRQQAPSAPAPAPVQTVTRVIAIYEPHNGLRHLALVQTYPNTPPVVGFTTAIPRAGAGADEKGGKIPAPPPGLLDSAPGKPTASAAASSQPQMQFNLIAGRGAGSVLLNARFGYATRREGRFTLPFAAQSVFPVLSAHALQRLVRELEAAVAQAQALMDASRAVLSSGTAGLPSSHSATTAAAAKAAKMKTLQKLLATSANRESQLWTDKLLITTSQGTTAPYHVGRTMELDWWTGFATSERTLAVATLKYGAGYVQVTPRGIHVLQPTSKEAREQEKRQGAEVVQTAPTATGSPSSMASSLVQPTTWTHRHGKMILAAAATPTTVLTSFAQGGVASFTLGLTGTQLEQSDDLPTFPPCPAVSLLQPSSESLTGAAMDAQLKAFLFDGSGTSSRTASAALSGRAREELELAAVATIAQEVYLMDPRKLREPLERISCKSVGHADSHHGGNEEVRGTLGEDGSVTGSQSGAIVSVLLTYLGGGGNGGGAGGGAAPRTGSSASSAAAQQHQQQQRGRRLFCFIGHMNGTLTRCELDPISAKVIARDELTCGTAPCQVISGDGQTVCYVQSGIHAWRSEVRDGVPKLVPWRFPSRQAAFAYFMRPSLTAPPAAATSAPSKSSAVKKEPRGENDMGGHDSDDDDDKEAREAEAEAAAQRANGEGEGNGAAASITFLSAAAASMAAGGASAASANLRHECVVALQHNELTLFSAQQSGSGASLLEYSFTAHSLPVAGRRILQHTTRPAYYVILSTEHRGYSMADVKRMRAEREDRVRIGADGVPVGPIPLDAPQRALGFGNVYNSTLQLYHEEGNRVLPRYFFPEGEAVLCGTVGSFVEDFGKEPVLVVGAASHYTHGAGCGGGARWSQGWLCAFRFTTATANAAGAAKRLGAAGDALLRIEPLHRTVIRSDPNPKTGGTFAPDYPSAVHLCEDVGLLFVGLGADHGLRVYVWGQQQFLRRCHLPDVPSRIVAIETAWVAPPPGSATADSSNFLSDLYHVPFSRPEAMKKAREQRLLVFCATASHSVLVASLQSSAGSAPGSRNGAPSFLMVVARDAVPRSLTSSLVVLRDGRTLAVADRFGNVTFLRVPLDNRNGFSVPVGDMRDAQLAEAEDFISHEQFLEEVASHATGQVVTALQKQSYDPSNGADAALDIEMVVYSTALGAVGAYVPFVAEADAALAAYAQPLLASNMRTLLAPQTGALPAHLRGHLTSTAGTVPGHHIIEGDLFHAYRHQAVGTTSGAAASSAPTYVTSSIFTAEAKAMVEDDLKRARHVEAARRRVLGLPARELPELSDLIAKQRALASLPQ